MRGIQVEWIEDPKTGLEAAIAVDRLRFGRAAGGVRIRPYGGRDELEAEARALARAMTRKAALADLKCGGAKVVMRAREGMDRPAALARLGERVEARRGALFVGPDYGFGEADRLAMAGATRYVDDPRRLGGLDRSTALGVREALKAALARSNLSGARLGVLGLGKVGLALVRLLRAESASVVAHDPDPAAAAAGGALGAQLAGEAAIVEGGLDAIAPCALGRWLDVDLALRLRARAVAGSANDLLASEEAGAILDRLGVALVPDLVSSAGAFIHWAAATFDGLDPSAAASRVLGIGPRARDLLARARAAGRPPAVLAVEEADALVAAW